ncbi:MAG TPA: PilZ domain-containing protein [Terracidiphilus sp.]|nr:PilZ domain-containing protein [Terracidiphilus sp.]
MPNENADKVIGLAAHELERRGMPRCPLDEEAALVLVSLGKVIAGRIVELSGSGCRMVLAEELPRGEHAAVEASFKLRGIAFRLSGLTEWTSGGSSVEVSFGPMSPRRRDDLLEVLCEVEASLAPQRSDAGGDRVLPERPDAERPDTAMDGAGRDEVIPSPRNRRGDARCGVDTSAVIRLVKIGSRLSGQILDVSLSGCRIRTAERFPVGIYTRVEVEFRLRGTPLQLGGVVQAIHGRKEVGIRFLDVSARKREQLAELIAEIRAVQGSEVGRCGARNAAEAG